MCASEIAHRLREAGDLDRGGFELLAARECEQMLDQLRTLLSGMASHCDNLRLIVAQRDTALDHAESAQHRREKIVEIVRDAAGQLPDRVHFAGLGELALQFLAVGHVEQCARELDGVAKGIAQQHRLIEEMLVLAIGALPAILDRQRLPRTAARHRLDHALAILRVETIHPQSRGLLDLFEYIAGERVEVAADELGDARLRVDFLEIEDDRQRLDDRRLALLGEAELLFDPQSLGIGAQIGVEQLPAPAEPCAESPSSS